MACRGTPLTPLSENLPGIYNTDVREELYEKILKTLQSVLDRHQVATKCIRLPATRHFERVPRPEAALTLGKQTGPHLVT